MSTTLINYDSVVQELSKGLWPLSDNMVQATCPERWKQLLLFRTLKFGSARQRGLTQWATANATSNTLIIVRNKETKKNIIRELKHMENPPRVATVKTLAADAEGHMFDKVFVDEAGAIFWQARINNVYNLLQHYVTDDVVIYHLN